MADNRIAIGVDVGGSGIKVAAVDVTTGQLVSDRLRVATPDPSTPEAMVPVITRLVRRVGTAVKDTSAPVGVGVPCVVIGGVTLTAANIDAGWVGYEADQRLTTTLKREVIVLNDADAAGLAEVRFGAGRDKAGVVLLLTLGTGVGSGLFVDGKLVPNTELGHMEIRGRDAERRSAAAARVRRGLSWKAWANDLDEHLHAIDRILWPSLIIIGGGVSKRSERFLPRLTARPPIVPAELLNDAGIVGAALAAAEKFQPA
jgi:polyphosphate glucokinase